MSLSRQMRPTRSLSRRRIDPLSCSTLFLPPARCLSLRSGSASFRVQLASPLRFSLPRSGRAAVTGHRKACSRDTLTRAGRSGWAPAARRAPEDPPAVPASPPQGAASMETPRSSQALGGVSLAGAARAMGSQGDLWPEIKRSFPGAVVLGTPGGCALGETRVEAWKWGSLCGKGGFTPTPRAPGGAALGEGLRAWTCRRWRSARRGGPCRCPEPRPSYVEQTCH